MVIDVMSPAEPANFKRLGIIVVVHLSVFAAHLAGLALDLTATEIDVRMGATFVFKLLFLR
jgi:hypothetical protein